MSTVIPIPPEQQLVAGGAPVPFDVSPDGVKLVLTEFRVVQNWAALR